VRYILTPRHDSWLDGYMEATTTAKFLHLLWEHFCSCTTDPEARTCLLRTAKARPVAVGPIHGWEPAS
jgi:hypothetical protein